MQHHHGGDVESYTRKYGRAPIDFSANVSPLGLPEGVRRAAAASLAHASEYPDPLCRRLREAIAAHEGLEPGQVVCGNGAADLIYRLTLSERPRRALLTAPTFAEYEAALATVGCRTDFHLLTAENGFGLTERILADLTPETDMVFLCQPNNPTGRLADRELLLSVLEKCRAVGARLVMDECFIGLLDAPGSFSLRDRLNAYPNLLILRAFTKLYAMPGLRLGYALSSDAALLGRLCEAAQPWAVSLPAQAAGIAALGETAYVREVLSLLRAERPFLTGELTRAGAEVLGASANYVFFRSPDAKLCEKLLDRGILLRDCSNYRGLGPGYCRAAVRTHADNLRLAQAVRDILNPD